MAKKDVETSLRVNSKNCPEGDVKFCAISGNGILNENKSTKKKEHRDFIVKIECDEEDAKELMDQIDDLVFNNYGDEDDIVKLPYQTNDDYDGIPKGKVWIEAKCSTEYEDDDGEIVDVEVTVYDSEGDKCKLPEGETAGEGSTAKVFGTVTVWDNKDGVGASLWLKGIQIGDYEPYVFEEAPEKMKGKFKGFDKKSKLDKDEEASEETTSSRRSRRSRATEDDEQEETSSRRNRRSRR